MGRRLIGRDGPRGFEMDAIIFIAGMAAYFVLLLVEIHFFDRMMRATAISTAIIRMILITALVAYVAI